MRQFGEVGEQAFKWWGGVTDANGTLWGIPHDADRFLEASRVRSLFPSDLTCLLLRTKANTMNDTLVLLPPQHGGYTALADRRCGTGAMENVNGDPNGRLSRVQAVNARRRGYSISLAQCRTLCDEAHLPLPKLPISKNSTVRT
jgi:hypothetical protein